MSRTRSRSFGAALSGLTVLLLVVAPAAAAEVATYDDPGTFSSAVGDVTLTRENFDSFDDAFVINDQIPGVVFSSPNQDLSGYVEIHVRAGDLGASSRPNVLFGGYVSGVGSILQAMTLDFSPVITAFAFHLCDYIPTATPASIRFEFTDESSQTFLLSNTTGSETTPVFFGAISDTPVLQVTITSGREPDESFEEFTIDDLQFGLAVPPDTNPPICGGTPATEGGILGVNGRASDIREFDTGIESVELLPGFENVVLFRDPDFVPGARATTFRIEPFDPESDGRGTVRVTDGAGNFCDVPATFRALGPGPLANETLCSGEGFLFSVSIDAATDAGPSACSANLPNASEPPLPPGYTPSPPDDPFPCQVLTIDSPVAGSVDMTLKKDGDFDSRLRMLYSQGQIVGDTVLYPDFMDVTLSVEEIATVTPDPTRIRGSAQWSPVKVTCALLIDDARAAYCDGLFGDPGPDFDQDGFTLCGSATEPRPDCNDQIRAIHPGADEMCNGMDDDCDGTIDEDGPLEGAGVACRIPGLYGICAQGVTSCTDGPLTCEQTVFPAANEIACNGLDDDCDGATDEAYVFTGYLPPLKNDGSSVFLKKRGAIPVKFRLADCAGALVTDAVARIEVHFVMNGVIGDEIVDVESTGAANTDDLFRFDPVAGQYIYNLDASALASSSSYVIRTVLDDGTTHDVTVSIK